MFGAGAVASMLAACTNTTAPSSVGGSASAGPGGVRLARKDSPVRLPLFGMEPIESGLSPEKGPLQLFTFAGYISPEEIGRAHV